MADVVLFHHVQGLTDGVKEFAERLAGETHRVHTPDLYQGAVAPSMDDGFAIKNGIGDRTLAARAEQALDDLPPGLVYAGISLGVMTAQQMTQTRPHARGALLFEACIPITGEWAFGPWPKSLPVQVHGMDDDEFFAHEGDLDAARELVTTVGPEVGELFTYPGNHHLFVDSSLPSYDAEAAALVVERSRAFLDRLDRAAAPSRAALRAKAAPHRPHPHRTDRGTARMTMWKKPSEVKLLSGGNPQIPKGDGDEPVQAYIEEMPGWKRSLGERIDQLVVAAVPDVHKKVRWNQPFYGVDDDTVFVSFRCFTNYVQICFHNGSSLDPLPPKTSKHPEVRYLDIHEHDDVDEVQLSSWFEQGSELPGEQL